MHIRRTFIIIVLCQLLFVCVTSALFAQVKEAIAKVKGDTSFIFVPNPIDVQKYIGKPTNRHLEGILTAGIGPYTGFNKGEYRTFLQPSIGFDFAAKPADFIEMLIGAHLGFSDPLTTAVFLGIRHPFFEEPEGGVKLFADLEMVFFDEAERLGPIGLGLRGAIGGRMKTLVNLEYRVAGEYRGSGSVYRDGSNSKGLWWVGVEAGIAFSLSSEKPLSFSRKDSMRASLVWIATSDDLKELDAAGSSQELDEFYDKFWARRDLTPNTRYNESQVEYERRVHIANQRYSRPGKLGIATDMGRAFVLYGEPDEIEEETSALDNSFRYVLWVYRGRINTVGTGLFLFETYSGRDSRQSYSNVPGESSGSIPRNLPKKMAKWF